MKVLVITGYKAQEMQIFKKNDPALHFIKLAIRKRLTALLEEHHELEWVVISGQIGVELWAAEVVYDLQELFPLLKLAVFTPFLEQEANWNEQNREYYDLILSQANHIDFISKKKYESPMQLRNKNQFIVDKSDAMLIVYESESPGSPRYILEMAQHKARQMDYPIYIIDSYELQVTVEDEQYNTDFE
ncbi:DUF1273 domain-containing protein [Sutcliffiella rhizosphaerae]|uniref:UPF0398 protein BACCIP111883_03390 n=1 Tax=Sutcliffiella rhizosphaerae TaxID=2880967 RepID=A0ABM8YRH6_9BACI|nr:DUF1273 domain-containing protein [Sutcliffiella rhizosphaerae]CAG9622599.1 hypothetical protein BACCIP111883_03390 [Sutcliffiella rhizosphaerae]